MFTSDYTLDRFLKAQEHRYSTALQEIRNGRKRTHWVWFIFPQIKGLGKSIASNKYAIRDLDEAKEYLNNDILRSRLIEISGALLEQNADIKSIMGSPDHLKVCSCMTLFMKADPSITVFSDVLNKFYNGIPDRKTLELLGNNLNRL
ncbi:MAG: DUF1810 domain-containing protein [Ruminiclostridium sp.]|nr:DUF1810 domain-containing protein [Ruminiclostridium sp.]